VQVPFARRHKLHEMQHAVEVYREGKNIQAKGQFPRIGKTSILINLTSTRKIKGEGEETYSSGLRKFHKGRDPEKGQPSTWPI